MSVKRHLRAVIATVLVAAAPGVVHAATEQQNLEELRNTVINLLQALVDQGLMTREKAATLVKQAQEKAAADAVAAAKKDEGAVRVPYVPQMVKDEIAKQVAEQVTPSVVQGVVTEAKSEGWGVPGALPDWLGRVRVIGDIRVRAQGDFFATNNYYAPSPFWLDFNAINAAGGFNKAITANTAYLNVTENDQRLRLRARFGAISDVTPDWQAGFRISTLGNAADPDSESQNQGTTSAKYIVGIDEGYIRYQPHTVNGVAPVTVTGGRFLNPWFSPTELVYARDLTFEGIAATGRYAFGSGSGPDQNHAFLTLGVIPVQFVPVNGSRSKWMLGAQAGDVWPITPDNKLTVGAAYYDFIRVTGVPNPVPGSTIYNYTAPQFVRFGNTMFAITTASATDLSPGLYGLAAHFRIVDLATSFQHSFGRYAAILNVDGVRNVGYDAGDVLRRTGVATPARTKGYVVDATFGDPDVARWGQWRTTLGYRYVERDAVLDAWTDSDFHLGGTNTSGYYLSGDLGIADHTWMRIRYLSGNTLDVPTGQQYIGSAAPKYGVDVLQVDLNTRF